MKKKKEEEAEKKELRRSKRIGITKQIKRKRHEPSEAKGHDEKKI